MLAVSAAGTAIASSSAPPALKASPHSVMVNTDTTITGKGFMPGSSVQLTGVLGHELGNSEVSMNTADTVTTNDKGTFKSPFKTGLCPGGKRGKEPTSEICYIGVSKPSGIDTVGLSPYAKVIVTYP